MNNSNNRKDIQKLKDSIKWYCLNDTFDFYSGCSEKEKINNCIESEFKNLISMYRVNNQSFDSIIKNAYLAGPTFRKRKKAIQEYALKANEMFKEKYPDLSIGIEFCKYACEPFFFPYENLDAEEFIIEAASIYVLEELFDYSLENKAFKYMPKDEESLSKAITHPYAEDCLFSDELIESMCYLFQNQTEIEKNEEAHLLTMKLAESQEFEIKEYNKANSNKEKLLSILSLLPKKQVERVINNFRNDVWRFVDLILNIENRYQKEFNKEKEFIDNEIRKLETEVNNYDSVFVNKDISLIKSTIYTKNIEDSTDILGDILNTKHLLRLGSSFMYFDNVVLNEEIESEYSKELFDFEISNPYETCFAFMYLLSINDSIVWLFNPCLTILKKAALKLPWTKDYNMAQRSNEKENELSESKFKDIDKIDTNIIDNKIDEANKELYKLKYNDAYYWENYKNAEENDLLKLNFPQFCYNFNEIIPPRNNLFFKDKIEAFLASGFGNDKYEVYEKTFYLLDGFGTKMSFENSKDEDNENYKDEINLLHSDNIDKDKKIDILNERVKNLQNSFNALKKEFKKYKDDYHNDTEEIYRLRELAYSLQNSNSNEDIKDEELKIELPYFSPKKALVLGGSENWIKKMKEVLHNVSFISSKQKINIDVIKNVDAIWIQIIQLSHSDFYAVTNYAKAHNVPIYYFSYSSIEKCIKQFVDICNK